MTAEEDPLTPDHVVPASERGDASDSELIRLVRAGDSAAYEHLFLRHREVAIRYARRISDSERAEDLCAEAFTKILDLLQRGKGPDVAFRAYLLTTVRTSHLNNVRSGKREDLVPDHEPITRMLPSADDPDARFDAAAIYRAFDKLPERWQAALWLTSVEGLSNEEASRHLGVKVNAVASLAFRARAGLRRAYLSEQLLGTTDPHCRRIIEFLPNYLRDGLTPRRKAAVEAHLSTCASCTTAALELSEVNGRLGALLAPLALTGFAMIIPAKATSLTAVGLTALSGAGSTAAGAIKGVVFSTVVQGKAAGAAVSGMVSTKLTVAATITAIGVAVGAQVVDHGPAIEPTDLPTTRPLVTGDELLPSAPSVSVAPPRSTPAPASPRLTVTAARPTSILRPQPQTPSPSAAPTPSPTPSTPSAAAPTAAPTSAPVTPAPRMSVNQPSSQTYTRSGFQWEQVTVPVSNPAEDTFLTVTTTRTLSTALATTTGTGWVCGTPVSDWFDGGFYATSTISCMYTGNGDPGPLRFDYQVVTGSVLTAELTPPTGFPDNDLADNLRQLRLR